MRSLAVLASMLLCVTLSCTADGRRVKRRLDEFGEMILLKTTRNPLDFNGYGNFCGFGGSGTPVDDIDKCCQVHDRCYMKLNRAECESLLKYKVYTTQYRWSFRRGDIFCSELDACKRELCECDRVASTCFGDNEHVYDTRNKRRSLINGLAKLVGMDFTKS